VIVAVHQPNFFPWLGYFDKMIRSDVFIVLDDAQFPKKGGTWMNRVQFLRSGVGTWLTAPVDRSYSGFRSVAEMRFAGDANWRACVWRTLEQSYETAPCWGEVREVVFELVHRPVDSIVEYNLGAIRALASAMGVACPTIRLASEFGLEAGGTERLIQLVRAVGGSEYLCGAGSGGYLEPMMFVDSGVRLHLQNFRHPRYPQNNSHTFVAGLSVIDLLANLGWSGAAASMNSAEEHG